MPITEPAIDNLLALQYTIQAVTDANDVQTPASGTLALYAIGSTIYSMNHSRVSVTQTPLSGNVALGTTSADTLTINSTIAADFLVGTNKKIEFRATSQFVNSSTAGQLDLGATTKILLTSTTVETSAALNVIGDFSVATNKLTVASATGNTVVAGTFKALVNLGTTFVTITPGATPTVNCALGNDFKLTPGEDETLSATNVPATGQEITIIVLTSGTTSRTLTFGSGFLPNGTLATGTVSAKTFLVRFKSNGTVMVEMSRTTAL